MYIVRTILLAITCFFFFNKGESQIAFYKIFTNNGYDYGQGVTQLADSSYLICGSSSSFDDGPSQAFLLKIDSLGNYKWSLDYGGSEEESARRVLYKEGFGCFLAGFTNSYGNGAYDAYLVKTNENGIFEWDKTYGGENWERIHDAVLTRDTGVIMVGQSNSTANSYNDIYIVRTNSEGDTLWTKTFGGSGDDQATSIIKYTDSTFFIGGSIYVDDSLQTKGFILSISEDGEIFWIDTLGSNGNYEIRDIDLFNDKVDFVGWRKQDASSHETPFSGRIFTSGVYISEATEYPPLPKIFDQIMNIGPNVNNYIAYRYMDTDPLFDMNVSISRFTHDLYWEGIYVVLNNEQEEEITHLIPTSDGGAIGVGYNRQYGVGGANVVVIKIGPNDQFPVTTGVPVTNNLVAVEEVFSIENSVTIYPNPFANYIEISSDEIISSLIIYDLTGKIIIQERNLSTTKIETEKLFAGSYLLEIRDQNGNVVRLSKLIKQ